MESTSRKTAAGKPWCRFRESRSINSDYVFIFTDGSSTGWHSAVLIVDGVNVRRVCRFAEPGPMRNVAAELRALILGLQYAPKGRECYVVHDYLGVGAWYIGAWEIKKGEVRKLIQRAKTVAAKRQLTLNFIHHGGHGADDSDFTYWNNEADALCRPPLRRLGNMGTFGDD